MRCLKAKLPLFVASVPFWNFILQYKILIQYYDSLMSHSRANSQLIGPLTDRKMPCQWMVPRSASHLYTGREELGKRLAQVFSFNASSNPKQQRTFVIIGRGGTGKSEVCLKFAEVHRGQYVYLNL